MLGKKIKVIIEYEVRAKTENLINGNTIISYTAYHIPQRECLVKAQYIPGVITLTEEQLIGA